MYFSLGTVIFLLAFMANVLLGLLVLLRAPKSATAKLFFLLVSTMSVWGFFNVLSAQSSENLLFARFVLFFAVVFATLFFLFAHTFPSTHLTLRHNHLMTLAALSATVMGLTLTPLVFRSIEGAASGAGVGQPVVGPGIALFALTVAFYDIGGLVVLVRKVVHAKAKEKKQRLYLFIGLGLMLITIIATNFILPTVFKDTRFIPYASAFMFPFVVFTSYAILKHRLLDIKSIVTRSVAYVLLLLTLASFYAFAIFGVTSIFFDRTHVSMGFQAVYVALALLLAFTFQPLKLFFDRVTERVFFRESYSSQELLNEISTMLAAQIKIGTITHRTLRILCQELKLAHGRFIVFDEGKVYWNQTYNNPPAADFTPSQLAALEQKHLLITDELEDGHDKNFLVKHDIGALVQLKTPDETVGYLLMGPKQTGSIYSPQDIQVLFILSKELVIAIQNARYVQKISEFNTTLQQQVYEATRKLGVTNQKLRALDETKDEFISMASHQLRTPLTSVKGYISMVLEGDAGQISPLQRKLLNQAFISSQRMVYLISDLLNVSRIRTGKFVIEPITCDLSKVVKSEADQLMETARLRNLELSYDLPDHFPSCVVDETKIRQVIMNFIDNAIYYTPSGGHINLTLVDKPQTIEFTCMDDGLGVPKHEQHHLFSKFFRAGNAKRARPDGTGLGLFMAKKVIIAHGGAIIFKSQEGKGSTFGFSLVKDKLPSLPSASKT